MKTKLNKALLFFSTIILLSSCNPGIFNGVKGNRNIITKNRKINSDFSRIKVSAGLELHLTQGNNTKIVVEADENLHDIIITEVVNGTLKVYPDKSIWRAKATKIYVTFKSIESLTATSGSDMYSENEIIADDLTVSATSGADINIRVKAKNVQTKATSGADLKIGGTTENHTTKATSGASIKAYGLRSKNVTAAATSGADIHVYASEKINARATSSADIDFSGHPKKVSKASTSGGSVSEKQ